MTYQQLQQDLQSKNCTRVERDDRLLDILPHQTREKGIELWEYWDTKTVRLTRISIGSPNKSPQTFSFPRQTVEQALSSNQPLELSPKTT